MSNTMQSAPTRDGGRPPWSTDVVGAGAAVVCALITWLFTTRLANLELTVRRGTELEQVGGGAVALTAGGSALVAFAALRLLERVTSRALAPWTVLAVVVTLLSLLGPLSATSSAAAAALVSMHTVVAAVVISSAHASRRRRRTIH